LFYEIKSDNLRTIIYERFWCTHQTASHFFALATFLAAFFFGVTFFTAFLATFLTAFLTTFLGATFFGAVFLVTIWL
jgi:hypothetical protein|tara:strand:+ start:119 stop:349 length:231 start_codon:yes stop_codon:yes gene_type:complete